MVINFQLDQSSVFVADTAEIPKGKYNFYFAILPDVKSEVQQHIFIAELEINITEGEDVGDVVADPVQIESKLYSEEVLTE